jgi:hypothetical protein
MVKSVSAPEDNEVAGPSRFRYLTIWLTGSLALLIRRLCSAGENVPTRDPGNAAIVDSFEMPCFAMR